MERTIVAGADLSGAALADLKSWLGISRPNEDTLLIGLLQASVALCEAFTGQAPLVQTVDERVSTRAGQSSLSSKPVQSLVAAELVAQDGTRSPLAATDYSFILEASHRACFELKRALDGQAIAVQMLVGIADDWATLPDALRQGVIRMAAHHYRDRDRDTARDRSAPPPASVAALWRPWRTVRLV